MSFVVTAAAEVAKVAEAINVWKLLPLKELFAVLYHLWS